MILIFFAQAFKVVFKMKYILLIVLFCVYSLAAMPSQHLLNEEEEGHLKGIEVLYSNQHVQKKNDFSEAEVDEDSEDDIDNKMAISELSDRDMKSLVRKINKKELSDVSNTEVIGKSTNKKQKNKKLQKSSSSVLNKDSDRGSAFFKLDDNEVEPFNFKVGVDPKYLAHQKIQNLIYSAPAQNLLDLSGDDTEENKEILFDILTAQLKKLCCKSRKTKHKKVNLPEYEPLLSIANPHEKNKSTDTLKYEQMFLIINDEIKSSVSSDIVYVDPDSLNINSTVVLLGPITTPLSDSQLNVVINRISSELSNPEYLPLLEELAEGKFYGNNSRMVKSLVSGSNTRRFVKPHRCRQRYPLSQGPKWLVCTGYLNLNTPSLYD